MKNSTKIHLKSIINDQKGFSLVEMLIVLALLGIVLAGAYQYFFYGYNSWTRSNEEAEQVQTARLAVMRMDSEVRGAQQGTENADPVVLVSDKEIRIYTDTDNDGHPELVCYKLVTNAGVNSLRKSIVSPQGAAYPYTYSEPNQWETVVSRVDNDNIFSVPKYDTNKDYQRWAINVELHVSTPEQTVRSTKVKAVLTVRGRGEVKT